MVVLTENPRTPKHLRDFAATLVSLPSSSPNWINPPVRCTSFAGRDEFRADPRVTAHHRVPAEDLT